MVLACHRIAVKAGTCAASSVASNVRLGDADQYGAVKKGEQLSRTFVACPTRMMASRYRFLHAHNGTLLVREATG